jgi:hypothetical protein
VNQGSRQDHSYPSPSPSRSRGHLRNGALGRRVGVEIAAASNRSSNRYVHLDFGSVTRSPVFLCHPTKRSSRTVAARKGCATPKMNALAPATGRVGSVQGGLNSRAKCLSDPDSGIWNAHRQRLPRGWPRQRWDNDIHVLSFSGTSFTLARDGLGCRSIRGGQRVGEKC